MPDLGDRGREEDEPDGLRPLHSLSDLFFSSPVRKEERRSGAREYILVVALLLITAVSLPIGLLYEWGQRGRSAEEARSMEAKQISLHKTGLGGTAEQYCIDLMGGGPKNTTQQPEGWEYGSSRQVESAENSYYLYREGGYKPHLPVGCTVNSVSVPTTWSGEVEYRINLHPIASKGKGPCTIERKITYHYEQFSDSPGWKKGLEHEDRVSCQKEEISRGKREFLRFGDRETGKRMRNPAKNLPAKNGVQPPRKIPRVANY